MNDTSRFRLLPWRSLDGKACYLSTADPNSRLSRLADEMEEDQIDSGGVVLEGAREVLADEAAGEVAVRFALTQAVLSLGEVLVVARSRGQRLPDVPGR
ncbi:sulfatase [Streptomyces californicus]|uniref:sulfatase n=1 Tax=Streptomyces TaxID=1883 RepID=UPI001901D6AE|nr:MULTISPECIES: sulfatase [unclassified Streptomyces]MBK0376394.1 sulfatase [Streptomyces sp. RB110-1]MBK0387232.1 sulfatase [Streptomyces sp. RB110-2]